MEFKKKTLIWETNTEPPKNYIWIKEDGKAYEYDYSTKRWIESKIVSSGNSDVDKKFKIIEDTTLGITLEPDIDEKYYQYFTIEATEDDTVVYFRQSSYAVSDGIAPLKVEVSTDDGETWQEIVAAPAKDDVPGAEITTLRAGDKILVRGDNEAYGYYSDLEGDFMENCNFWADKNCYVYGNIMSLISKDVFARLRKVKERAFTYFFSDHDGALSPWVLSKEEEMLLLPATTLADECYYLMFNSCYSLTIAPKLPATKLAPRCYYLMFQNCTGLTTAPELPATTLADGCYGCMFNGCTSLTTAPTLPATTLAPNCYYSMFEGCTSLTTAPALPATTLAYGCYSNMFYRCTSLTSAPTLPATTLAPECYYSMFNGCTSLTIAPALPATTLDSSCYRSMFCGCTSLTTAPALPANTLADGCYGYMFNGCTSLTTAPALPATTLNGSCYNGMFYGCTSLTTAPALPATTLAANCYKSMFSGCTSLTTAPTLPATTLVSNCYISMFDGCSSLTYIKALFTTTPGSGKTDTWVRGVSSNGTFVKSNTATWNVTGNNGIPTGWTVETADA